LFGAHVLPAAEAPRGRRKALLSTYASRCQCSKYISERSRSKTRRALERPIGAIFALITRPEDINNRCNHANIFYDQCVKYYSALYFVFKVLRLSTPMSLFNRVVVALLQFYDRSALENCVIEVQSAVLLSGLKI